MNELIDSDALAADDLDTEVVSIAALGGAVRVQALDLVQRLAFERRMVALRTAAEADKRPGEDAWLEMVPEILELCVLDKNARPVKSAARWRRWGSKHLAESVQLFNVAWRFSTAYLPSNEMSLTPPGRVAYDFNKDRNINAQDLSQVAQRFGTCGPATGRIFERSSQ